MRTDGGQEVDVRFDIYGDPAVVETNDGAQLLVSAVAGGRFGIAAVDATSGEFESSNPVAGESAVVSVSTVGRNHATATVRTPDGPTTVLLDYSSPKTPATVWEDEGTQAQALLSDAVVVQKQKGFGLSAERSDVRILGLGKDKEVRWSSRDARADESPVAVDAEDSLVFVNWKDGTEVIDAADGSSLAGIGKDLRSCVGDTDPIMCEPTPDASNSRMGFPVTVTKTDAGVELNELRRRTILEVTGSTAGNYFVEQPDGAIAVDSTGVLIDDNPPGGLRSISDDGLALFRTSTGQNRLRLTWEVRRLQ